MKNRVYWFLGFYALLSVFIIYELIYVSIIWSNGDLRNLYSSGYTIKVSGDSQFIDPSYAKVFVFPLLGLCLSFTGVVTGFISQLVVLKKTTANKKGFFLISSFIIFMIGFYFSFAGQLFYNQWNDSRVTVTNNVTGEVKEAIMFYKNWLSLTMVWTIFGIFFGIAIFAIILIVKLYFLNIQWARYVIKYQEEEITELELTAPLPSNKEFNPNETQTITITLDQQTLNEEYKNSSKKKTGSFIFNKLEIKKKNKKTKVKKLIKKKK